MQIPQTGPPVLSLDYVHNYSGKDVNQVNNSPGFPGIFRGALDVGAMTITDEMALAAAGELAIAAGSGLNEERKRNDAYSDAKGTNRTCSSIAGLWRA